MIYGKEIRYKERKNSKLEESKTKKQHSPRTLSSKKAGNEMKIHKTSQGKFLKHTHCYLSSQTPSRNSPRNPIFYAQSVLENTTKTVTNRNRNRKWKPAVSKDRFLWYFSFLSLVTRSQNSRISSKNHTAIRKSPSKSPGGGGVGVGYAIVILYGHKN